VEWYFGVPKLKNAAPVTTDLTTTVVYTCSYNIADKPRYTRSLVYSSIYLSLSFHKERRTDSGRKREKERKSEGIQQFLKWIAV